MERARVTRSTIAEAQIAYAGGADPLLTSAIPANRVSVDQVEAIVAAAMQASLRPRELSAMTSDRQVASLLSELIDGPAKEAAG